MSESEKRWQVFKIDFKITKKMKQSDLLTNFSSHPQFQKYET